MNWSQYPPRMIAKKVERIRLERATDRLHMRRLLLRAVLFLAALALYAALGEPSPLAPLR